jgi:endonuclease/exonuclease/phosphatase family metal-dependent hydrolase
VKSKWPKYPLFAFIFKVATLVTLLGLLISYFAPFVHPDTLWPIPFFGLLYPVFLFVSILLLVIHLLMQSRWSLMILVVLVLGGKLHMRQFAFASDEKELEGLKIMSYNVRLFDLYFDVNQKSESDREKIFEYLVSNSPDVVCFQEFYHQEKSDVFPTKTALVDLLQIVDLHERYSHRSTGRHNFGIVTMSKYPIIGKGEVPLEEVGSTKNSNYCIFVDIVKDKDTIRIYNTHLQSIKLNQTDYLKVNDKGDLVQENKAAVENIIKKLNRGYELRAEQARKVSAHSLESPYPVVICGDFNDTPLSYTYNQFIKHYIDAFREGSFGIGATYAGRIPAGRIDYIFHSPDLVSTKFSVQSEVLSDHRAISCVISKAQPKNP